MVKKDGRERRMRMWCGREEAFSDREKGKWGEKERRVD